MFFNTFCRGSHIPHRVPIADNLKPRCVHTTKNGLRFAAGGEWTCMTDVRFSVRTTTRIEFGRLWDGWTCSQNSVFKNRKQRPCCVIRFLKENLELKSKALEYSCSALAPAGKHFNFFCGTRCSEVQSESFQGPP